MKVWADMSYDEQRALLGLPLPPSVEPVKLGSLFAGLLRHISDLLGLPDGSVEYQSDVALAAGKW